MAVRPCGGGGNWWVGPSTGSDFVAPRRWASWSNVLWKDVRVADFDGDGRDDLLGRHNGRWWVARSTGAGSATGLWGTWSDTAWRAVGAVDATGHVVAASGSGAPVSAGSRSTSQGAAVALRIADDEPLALFWSKAEKDKEFAGQLIAG